MAGAGSTTSSLTTTSHTLTFSPTMAPTSASSGGLSASLAFMGMLEAANRHQFLRPSPSTPAASLNIAKEALDAFAGQVSDEQQQRLREANRKRKRDFDRVDALKIRKLHVDGFETDQVWQQTKRIINSALFESEATLQELEKNNELQSVSNGDAGIKTVEFGSDGFEVDSDAEEGSQGDQGTADSSDSDSAVQDTDEGMSGSEVDVEEEEDDQSKEVENEAETHEDDEEDDEDEEGSGEDDLKGSSSYFVEDADGLNDGFFSIDDFNKQTQWFEDQDARADPNTDLAASDDEEVDWHTDPFTAPSSKSKPSSSLKRPEKEDEDFQDGGSDVAEDDDDEEQGPTFGDMDLDAPEGASDDELGDKLEGALPDGLDLTADDIFYKDFFAPPPKKAKKGEKWPRKRKHAAPKDYDVETAMADVKRDLFEDMSDGSGSEDALSEVDAGDPKSRRSAHERRQAKTLAEIRKLEAELVKPKDWTLSGEAAAPERPLNSLLEEDLEFEHVGKPVPIITQEVSESIEEMIKRRILAQEFDELIRRLPGSEGPANSRRGLVDVDDKKAQQSLVELYEEDFVKDANPDTYVSKSDEKLRKEEKEIEQLWKEISGKLDVLSSWHYKPKPAAPTLTVVSDVATITMEDAQPTTAAGVNASGMLAPQEVYKAGKETAAKGEVVTAKSGLPLARQEMSREDKLRRRRREKERIRKGGAGTGAASANGHGSKKMPSKQAQERKETLADLKKGGVMVINRQGEIMDVDGNKPKAARAVTSGTFKL